MKAWELLSKPGAWCHGSLAKTTDGRPVGSHSSEAVSWCAVGALTKCYEGSEGFNYQKMVEDITEAAGLGRDFSHFVQWNNAPERTQAEVVAAFKEADV